MSIERVWIESEYPLEGVLTYGSKDLGVIICHPHPLYGGSMRNNVVFALERGFLELNFTTLKFNFRGVEKSGGSYDDGRGEEKDLFSAIEFLESKLNPSAKLVLAGYSFGAWICAKVSIQKDKVSDLLLVSYPFSVYEKEPVMRFKKRIYFLCGSMDEISPVSQNMEVYQSLPQPEKSITILETDHFYIGMEREIVDFVKRAFA
ncbi:MAG: hypothetical protein NZ583_02720 [Desulfobacterota bacterium]|nr:hypothetical protein [Thermodesulfobacteriota bacterium]MDW8001797.1 hypothetical protein [Deltaproteobacteria bacterium]